MVEYERTTVSTDGRAPFLMCCRFPKKNPLFSSCCEQTWHFSIFVSKIGKLQSNRRRIRDSGAQKERISTKKMIMHQVCEQTEYYQDSTSVANTTIKYLFYSLAFSVFSPSKCIIIIVVVVVILTCTHRSSPCSGDHILR